VWHNRTIQCIRFPREGDGEAASGWPTSQRDGSGSVRRRRDGINRTTTDTWERGDDTVMEFIDGATHDEIAVVACVAAMVGSMGLMLLSGTAFGNSHTRSRVSPRTERVRGKVSRKVGPKTAGRDVA